LKRQLQAGEIEAITYTPNGAVKSALDTIEAIQQESKKPNPDYGVLFGLPDVDKVMFPGRPGHVIAILGRTSHGKSLVMQWWARQQAGFIRERQAQGLSNGDECVVYVTWEQAIEEMICFDLAQAAKIPARDVMLGKLSDQQMSDLRMVHGPRRIATPIYLIGHSVQEGKARPALTLSAIRDGLRALTDTYDIKPRVLFLDYLQQITPEEGLTMEEQTRHNATALKDLAFEMRCVVVIGTQAKRESYKNHWLPKIDDSQWTSSLEQTCDAVWGIWYPLKSEGLEPGDTISKGNTLMEVTENLFIMGILKQRWGTSGNWWPLHVEPAVNDIHEMRTEAIA